MSLYAAILSFAGPVVPLSLTAVAPGARVAKESTAGGYAAGAAGKHVTTCLKAFTEDGRPLHPLTLELSDEENGYPLRMVNEVTDELEVAFPPFFPYWPGVEANATRPPVPTAYADAENIKVDNFASPNGAYPYVPLRRVMGRYRLLHLPNDTVSYSPLPVVQAVAWWLQRPTPTAPLPIAVVLRDAIVMQSLVDALATLPVVALHLVNCSIHEDAVVKELFGPHLVEVCLSNVTFSKANANTSGPMPVDPVDITRGVFSFFEHTTNLVSLSVDSCPTFTDADVAIVASCPALRMLQLSHLRGVQSINALSAAQNLRVLSVHGESAPDLEGIASCHNLEELDLIFTEQRRADVFRLPNLSSLARLARLRVHSLHLWDVSPLAGCTALRSLCLSGCMRVYSIAAFMDKPIARSLRRLFLRGTRLIRLPRRFATCFDHLVSLNLRDTLVRTKDVERLSSCSELRSLNIAECLLQPPSFAKFTNLAWLDISYLNNPDDRDRMLHIRVDESAMPALIEEMDLDSDTEGNTEEEEAESELAFRAPPNLRYLVAEGRTRYPTMPIAPGLLYLNISCSDVASLAGIDKAQQLQVLRAVEMRTFPEGYGDLAHLSSLVVADLGKVDTPNFSFLASSAQTLRYVRITETKATSLAGLASCTKLEHLFIKRAPKMQDVSSISALTQLKRLSLTCTGLADVDALGPISSSLSHVSLYGNRTLRSLAGTLRAPLWLLTEVELSSTAIEDLTPLRQCQNLELLDLSYCPNVESIDCLNGLRRLSNVWLEECGLRRITCLDECCELNRISLSHCPRLESVPGLIGLPSLHTLEITSCPLLKMVGRGEKVGRLWSVRIEYCPLVEDISCFEQEPRLKTLMVTGCKNLRALGKKGARPGYKRLDELYLYDCPRLESLSALASARHLTTATLNRLPIGDLSPLRESFNKDLRTLVLDNCPNIRSLSGLADRLTTTKVTSLSLQGAMIKDLSAVEGALANSLEELSLEGCGNVTSLSSLSSMAKLVRLNVVGTGIRNAKGLSPGCRALETVQAHRCPNLRAIEGFARLPKLHTLSLTQNPHLSLLPLRESRSLRELRLYNAGSADQNAIAMLRRARPELRVDRAW